MSTVDKGYAWVIPFSCFIIQATLFGTYRSYGLLYKILLDSLQISRSNASWPFSLCMTMIHLTGPISGSLNKYFSVRSITFTGCFLSSFGVALCYWSGSSMFLIIIGIGVIQGFGIGLTYVQNAAIINQYFIRYRATANGISLSGGTVGAFIVSPILEASLKHFQFHDCFLILSGLMLLTLPFCLLLKPFKTKEDIREKEESLEDGHVKRPVISCISRSVAARNGSSQANSTSTQFYTSNLLSLTQGIHLKSYSKIKDDHCIKSCHDPLPMILPLSPPPSPSPSVVVVSPEALRIIRSRSIAPVTSSPSSSPLSDSFMKSVKSIITDPMFMLIAVTHMSYFWSSITYVMIVIDFAQDKGISVTHGVDLISAFSLGDLIGRLGSGFILDRKVIPLQFVALSCTLLIGVFMNASIIAHGYVNFMLISGSLGFLSGIIVALLNQLFCKYLGADKAALAFGISAFMAGAVTTIRPLVVGSFRDQVDGSYDGLFMSLGVVSVLTGLLWFMEPLVAGWRTNPKERHLLAADSTMSIHPVLRAPDVKT